MRVFDKIVRLGFFAAGAAVAASAAGCSRERPDSTGAEPRPAAVVREAVSGGVKVSAAVEPGRVRLDRESLLTITVDAPTSAVARLPPMQDRLSGFAIAGAFERAPVEKDGRLRREYCFRLLPLPAEEYRVAPFAVTVVSAGAAGQAAAGVGAGEWFAGPAVSLDVEPVAEAPAEIHGIVGPQRIPPSPAAIGWYAVLVFLAASLVYGARRLAAYLKRAARLRRMSPAERALWELRELLEKNLVQKGRVKDFYVAITMIVRRYIERAHGVRAPRQTTEEFFSAASANPGFSGRVTEKLKNFLAAADLVKYAAALPTDGEISAAVSAAREYIETDAARPALGAGGGAAAERNSG